MARTDTIADALTMIRNAVIARKDNLDIPASNIVKTIIGILKKEDYIDNFKVVEGGSQGRIRVYLKYPLGKSAIRNLKRISRPGRKAYVKRDKIPRVLRGKGLAIVSTSKGILTAEEARSLGVGGEVICYVW